MTGLPWARWPWTRCRARHCLGYSCDLVRGHRGSHVAERGMDTPTWREQWTDAARLADVDTTSHDEHETPRPDPVGTRVEADLGGDVRGVVRGSLRRIADRGPSPAHPERTHLVHMDPGSHPHLTVAWFDPRDLRLEEVDGKGRPLLFVARHAPPVAARSPRDALVRDVVRAITEPGREPGYHRRIRERHRQEWPTLWRALEALVRTERP